MSYQSRHTGSEIDDAVDVYLAYKPNETPWVPRTCEVTVNNWVANTGSGNSSAIYQCVLFPDSESTTATTNSDTPFVWFKGGDSPFNFYYVDFITEGNPGNIIVYSNIAIAGTFYILGVTNNYSATSSAP